MKPNLAWRLMRRFTQVFAILAVVVAPFLGGWQRLERNDLSSWYQPDRELPAWLREQLPRGARAGDAYRANIIMGGGVGVEYLDVPTIDPAAAVLSMSVGAPSMRALLSLAIPVLIALIAGRMFCGWFCPFGSLSRTMAWLTDFIPWRKRYEIPTSRPVRYAILVGGLIAGLLGANFVLYLMLPHLLLQQALYSTWLLGGGGAAIGLLLGLLAAGLVVGPTTYCATICPTGAALALIGHKKVVRLQISQPSECGKTCNRCTTSCWLQLDPASGDPGPDCDLCARCEPQCPTQNLRIGIGRGQLKQPRDKGAREPRKGAKVAAAAKSAAVVLLLSLVSASSQAQSPVRRNPELLLAVETVVDGVTIAVDVIDQTGVRLSPTGDDSLLSGTDVAIFIARGERGPVDERGLAASRDAYDGPLQVHILQGREGFELRFPRANFPESTPRRTIFRRRIEQTLAPGDVLEIEPIEGWLEQPVRFTVPTPGVATSPATVLSWALIGFALFGGLLFIALSLGPRGAKAG